MNRTGRLQGNVPTTETRLLIDPPALGSWNMAIDEALLWDAAEYGVATVRFYQWREPTLSLGYFQSHTERNCHAASMRCGMVRRQTGGGAILHDRELTYSLALPVHHPLAGHTQELYQAVHDGFIAALSSLSPRSGTSWTLHRREQPLRRPTKDEPFLCFQRGAVGDVLLTCTHNEAKGASSWKILGSAQRRHRGAVLQHGSLLLKKSPQAPELPGLCDLAQASFDPDELICELRARLSAILRTEFTETSPSAQVFSRAQELETAKYSNPSWTNRR